MQHMVKDLKLKEIGRKKMNWAMDRMKVLGSIYRDLEKEKPFDGVNISMSLHLEAKTAVLAMYLQKLGAAVSITSSNPITCQDDVAAALTDDVSHVYAWRGETESEYNANHMKLLENGPNILVDDGADLTAMVASSGNGSGIYGVCEETTTGVRRLKALQDSANLKFPAIAVNDARGKYLYDNRFGSGQSVVDGIVRSTNIMLGGKSAVVAGFGWVGRGVAERLRGMGAVVTVVESDPFRALEAYFDGFTVTSMDRASQYGDVFITCTGDKRVISERHFSIMKDGAFLANAGHFDVEVDVAWLKANAVSSNDVRPNVTEFMLKNGKRLYLLAEGRLVNLGAADGHPIEIMDLSFSLQLLSALYLLKNHGMLENRVYPVPSEVDEGVVKKFLEINGVELEKLSSEQLKYIKSW
ncbi:MAG: adenosylhomocysteinase [Nitrososphaerota archaeon]|jgi:adenosylhomocysteinase|nr:adenosylhomocysteinase [Nitrososphaerota archaeon]MDG6927423.1 adenosylhomocysteinase [Nitrososphaerota archaeon]MDG6931227.1 adenosylhomocysteinase [Nitrososphaerota archaeon]MDG6931890.1 adenosylhomocysteinase [Nitrososphaerota archaeon]MDG6936590.1 adenosylhomocysteinase [Nitrososphaerota archaeon]